MTPRPDGLRSPAPRNPERSDPHGVAAAHACWLPWPLCRFAWWTRPVRAERLAAFRIGLAAVLLVDVTATYLPHVADLFGPDSLVTSLFSTGPRSGTSWDWSLVRGVSTVATARALVLCWALSAVTLLLGSWSRISAAVAWILAVSFFNLNPDLHDGGDRVRILGLMYLMLSPCGAVWSLDRFWRQRGRPARRNIYIPPWPLRLLAVQLALIYIASGLPKMRDPSWSEGSSVYYVLANLTWSTWAYAQMPLPGLATKLLTWIVPAWEVGFPLLVLMRRTRSLTLALGVLFHLALFATMRLGVFPLYMLCLYLPFVPWERCVRRWFSEPRP